MSCCEDGRTNIDGGFRLGFVCPKFCGVGMNHGKWGRFRDVIIFKVDVRIWDNRFGSIIMKILLFNFLIRESGGLTN